MSVPNLFLLYVKDPARSAAFYENLFEIAPAARFPTYAAFSFANGLTVGLWSTQAKNFVSGGTGHCSELAFLVPDADSVRRLHDRWVEAGVKIEQPLHQAIFGLTFVGIDPDGHRLRVCVPD